MTGAFEREVHDRNGAQAANALQMWRIFAGLARWGAGLAVPDSIGVWIGWSHW
jgi:hypothetical protein